MPLDNLHGLNPQRLFDHGLYAPAMPGDWELPPMEEVTEQFPTMLVSEIIGRGGMGAVYRALQPDIEREVAIKVLPSELSTIPEFAERFRREARLMASLHHPGLVSVFDYGETESGRLFYVMEFVAGGDLSKHQPLDVVLLIDQISAAVACAHGAGIVHRDLKPTNILIATDGTPKVADFGLARAAGPQSDLSRLTLMNVAMGTPAYAAPEQLIPDTEPTAAADVYSLGVIAYELLTGQLPKGVFDPPSLLKADVDPAFDAVILQAMQSDPARRFSHAGAFRAAWLRASDFRLQQQLREKAARAKLLRRTRLAFAFAGIALIAITAAVYGYAQQKRAEHQALRASSSRQSAEKLVGMVVDKMHGKLQDVGRIDLLKDVDTEVESYYAALPADERTATTALGEARFLQRRASMLRLAGDWKGALASASRAVDLLVPAAQSAPADVDAFLEAAQSLSTVAYLHQLRRDTTAGLPAAERLLGFVETAMPTLSVENKLVHFYHARALRRLADQQVLLERFDEAQLGYERAAAAIQRSIAISKPGPDLFTQAAMIEIKRGDLAQERKQLDAALDHYHHGMEMQRKTVKKGVFKMDVASSLQCLNSYIAGVHHQRGDFTAAKPFIEECRVLTEQIQKRSPDSTNAIEADRYYYRVLTRDLEHDGKHAEAQATAKKSNEAYAKWNKLKGGTATAEP